MRCSSLLLRSLPRSVKICFSFIKLLCFLEIFTGLFCLVLLLGIAAQYQILSKSVDRHSLTITCHVAIACKEQNSSVGEVTQRDHDSRV
jgi:hypothetical protein